MHLTNYAINKDSENFEANKGVDEDDQGSKRSMQSVLQAIEDEFDDVTMMKVQKGIQDIIIKSMCLAQPHVKHLIVAAQPEDIENQLCF